MGAAGMLNLGNQNLYNEETYRDIILSTEAMQTTYKVYY